MSRDQIEPLQFRSEASEPLCEVTADRQTVSRVTVDRGRDGGFVALDYRGAVCFAAGTIQEVCDYLEDRFGGGGQEDRSS